MSPPPRVLLTSLASSHVSQVGLLPVLAAHLTTFQLGLTPVSQWMVCMARCGEVCNRGVFIHFPYFMLSCLLLSTYIFLIYTYFTSFHVLISSFILKSSFFCA